MKTPFFTTWLSVSYLLLTPAVALAHHSSGAVFNLEEMITIDGVVSGYEWKNPHLYFYVESVDDSGQEHNWRIEAGPLAFMRRLGWDRDSLKVGERVTLTANPSRRVGIESAFLRSIETGKGVVLTAFASREAGQVLSTSGQIPDGRADSLAGVWVTIGDKEILGTLEDPTKLQLTAKGKQSLEDYNEETMHPGLNCIPDSAPMMMVIPDTKLIEMSDTIMRIRGEWDNAERIINFNAGTAPIEGAVLHGRSTARKQNGKIIVDTNRFEPHRMGTAYGVESGSRKRLREEFELNEDGRSLTYRFEMFDPDYIEAPFSGEVQWAYRPDLEYESLPCDLENSRLFIRD